MTSRLISLLGLVVMIGIAVLLSKNRKKISWKMVAASLGFQLVFALLVLATAPGKQFFLWVNGFVMAVLNFTSSGSAFVFGSLVTDRASFGFIFAFQVLPTIIFVSSLMGVLYYYGIMQFVVKWMAKVFMKLMHTSGAETLCATANIFVGQTEAPLFIKPYIEKMTKSELLTVMLSGFATISAGVMASYAGMLTGALPEAAGHLIAASLMSCPASLMFAKILIPETETPETMGEVKIEVEKKEANIIDAAASGASTGLTLALNVGAMLIAFIALIAMIDGILGLFGLSLQQIFGVVFWPVAWILGIPAGECTVSGNILAQHIVINEFVAYGSLSDMLKQGFNQLSPRSAVILIYAVCSFANFSSIAMQIAGIGGLAPSRRHDLARLGGLALVGAILAGYQTAAIAGIMIP